MGECFIMRRGGGSIGSAFAVIAVTYPVESTCICTNGVKTLKAKDTSGKYLFMIPEPGRWTVSCTDGIRTSQKSIEIITQYQSEKIKLIYGLLIVDNGQSFYEWTTNGRALSVLPPDENGAFHVQMRYSAPGDGPIRYDYFASTPAIDLTEFSILRIKASTHITRVSTGDVSTGRNGAVFGAKQYTRTGAILIGGSADDNTNGFEVDTSIDISQVFGPQYISFFASNWTAVAYYLDVYIAMLTLE